MCSASSNGAVGVHSCGILYRLEWWWGIVIYGGDQHLGTGWFETVSQRPRWTFACRDLAWTIQVSNIVIL